ncbi:MULTISPECIES: hypothetical protein [unclassified Streptomyces]|nr:MULTISPECIES: hypothetical protein [unclassified Streptomyces]
MNPNDATSAMTNTKARAAVMITLAGREAQDEARGAGAGRPGTY